MSIEIAVPIQTAKRLQNQRGDVLELAAGTTLQGVFSAQAWVGPFGIEFKNPSYMQVEFKCSGPERPFIYRGVLRPYNLLFIDGEQAVTSRPDEPVIERIGTMEDLFDDRINLMPVIDGETVNVRVRLMSSYFTIHLCPSNVLVHCRYYDGNDYGGYREIWYRRSYESLLFTNAPRYAYDRDGKPEDYYTQGADYVDFELL